MAPGPASALNIFISYAHEDEALRQELENALAPLRAALDVWHNRRISPGAYWNSEIEAHFDAAQIILLLFCCWSAPTSSRRNTATSWNCRGR